MEQCWLGLVRRGLIDDSSGVKFHQSFYTPDDRRLNRLAAINSSLYEIIRECNRPFYLDRYQGGSIYYKYEYDFTLLNAYVDLCGEWMLGLQLHEWGSNRIHDWVNLVAALGANPQDDPEGIMRLFGEENINYEGGAFPEAAPAEEYIGQKPPSDLQSAKDDIVRLITLRQNQNHGMMLPTDSYYMAIRQELAAGVKNLMPEVGAQIPFMRMQIALTRGMARDAGIKWGTYYEPWGGEPFGCAYYKRDSVNEWDIPGKLSPDQAFPQTNGGSSRALQKRIYYHSLLSGAHFLSEEWGTSNTFYDWNDYELTPYGLVKQEFLRFAACNPNLGDTFTPVALVLPIDFDMFDIHYLSEHNSAATVHAITSEAIQGDKYYSFPLENSQSKRFAHLRTILKLFLGDDKREYGNEGHVIGNSKYGDIFDIIYADIKHESLEKYDVLIDLDFDGSLSAKHPALHKRILNSKNISEMERELNNKLAKLLPIQVNGELSWILNRTKTGWVLGLFNNEGMDRNIKHGDKTMTEANSIIEISTQNLNIDILNGDPKALNQANGKWYYDLKASEVALLALT